MKDCVVGFRRWICLAYNVHVKWAVRDIIIIIWLRNVERVKGMCFIIKHARMFCKTEEKMLSLEKLKKINLNTNKTAHEEINGQIVGGNLRSCICWRIIIVLNGKHDLLDSIARLSINVSLTTWKFAIGLVITSSQTPKTNIPTPIQITSCHRNNSRINGVCSIELCYLFWQFPT